VKEGISFKDELVIDAHNHIGGYYVDFSIPFNDNKDYIAQMDRLGIDKICAFSYAGLNSEFTYGNNLVAKAVKEYPDRIIGFTALNFNYPKEWIAELERCRKMGLTKGIKLPGLYQGKTTKEAKLDPVYKYAENYGMVIINHDWGSPEFLDELAEKYPKACFIMGHPGPAEVFASVLNGRENVFECTTAASDEVKRKILGLNMQDVLKKYCD
jgi:predicted TIM-barrel fold metal-dependent hydrolase